MKQLLVFAIVCSFMKFSKAQINSFNDYPVYTGNDLGLTYTPSRSLFRIWSPAAQEAKLLFYKEGTGGRPEQSVDMQKSAGGTWLADMTGDQLGKFYVFKVRINNKWSHEVPDPYAKAVGVNGKRAMVIDLVSTDPAGWKNDQGPALKNPTDAVIYELQIRDAGIDASSGIKNKGKFIGLTETGTKNKAGLKTGLSHLEELGVTHVHLLPLFDFHSIDETKLDSPQYNWGYEPLNYNAPEGSFSTNPYDGNVRIKEFKELVQAFHKNGLGVVMDVVYNHTRFTEDSYLNELVPGYYYRQDNKGNFSNATACGNEIASERYMVRKFILESVLYWATEYHLDGFRFDLMGVHDIETMNMISEELHKIKPGMLIYGEGWTAGASPLPDSVRALKVNVSKLDRVAVFSDDIRDGIKGSVFDFKDKGFVSGKPGMEESIKFGVVASCEHPQVDYSKVNYSKAPYAAAPYQTITYCECHDNNTLWDKLKISATGTSLAQRKEMHKLALSIVLTSQGISFLHAGTEFLRTKKGEDNSYNLPDSINGIDWNLKTKNKDVFDYVCRLVKMRKGHPAFHMMTDAQIKNNIQFAEDLPGGVVAYTINGAAMNDPWKKIFIIYNGNDKKINLPLPGGKWVTAIENNSFKKKTGKPVASVNPFTCSVFYQQ